MRKSIHPAQNYRVDLWFPDNSGIERELAFIDDYEIAVLCYLLACRKYKKSIVSMRHGARVIREREALDANKP